MRTAEHTPARSVKETCCLEPHKAATGNHNTRHAAKYWHRLRHKRKSRCRNVGPFCWLQYLVRPPIRTLHAFPHPSEIPPCPLRLHIAHHEGIRRGEAQYPLADRRGHRPNGALVVRS